MPASADPDTPLRSTGQVLLFGRVDFSGADQPDEEDALERSWSNLKPRATQAIAQQQGQVLHHNDNTVLAAFPSAWAAAEAAVALHRLCRDAATPDHHTGRPVRLCIGLHAPGASSLNTHAPLPGADVAISLAGLAEPGETVAASVVRDQLTDDLDTQVQDLGDCYLKYLSDPVRTYRLDAREAVNDCAPPSSQGVLPLLAIVPLRQNSVGPEFQAVGELLTDRLCNLLGRSSHVGVISRLSAAPFAAYLGALDARDGEAMALLRHHLGARYLLHGEFKVSGSDLNAVIDVDVRLIDAVSGDTVWHTDHSGRVGELLSGESELVHAIGSGAHHALLDFQVNQTLQQPIQKLDDYRRLLSGIMLMHRSSGQAFERSKEALLSLLETDQHLHLAHAWLAKWYVLKVTRSLSVDLKLDGEAAKRHAELALATPGGEALAKAMLGFVQLHLERDFSNALTTITGGIDANPSEPLAWLFRGVAHSFLNQAEQAVEASARALELSPLDPLLYYFESLAASSHLTAGRYGQAILLCERSLRRNVTHLHTHRAFITALWADGHEQRARDAAQRMLLLKRDYTVAEFDSKATSANTALGRLMSDALRGAGVPMGR